MTTLTLATIDFYGFKLHLTQCHSVESCLFVLKLSLQHHCIKIYVNITLGNPLSYIIRSMCELIGTSVNLITMIDHILHPWTEKIKHACMCRYMGTTVVVTWSPTGL